jgi:hypothetical protein
MNLVHFHLSNSISSSLLAPSNDSHQCSGKMIKTTSFCREYAIKLDNPLALAKQGGNTAVD